MKPLANERGVIEVLLFLVFIVVGVVFFLQGLRDSSIRKRSEVAQKELQNAAIYLEDYYLDNKKYPASLDTPLQKREVVEGVILSHGEAGKDGWVLRAHHEKGTEDCMMKSGSHQLLHRERDKPEGEWKVL